MAHADDLRQVTGDEKLAEEVKADFEQSGLEERSKALLRFACRANHDAMQLSEADIEVLRKAGLSDRAILETVLVTGLFQYFNIVADALGIDLEEGMPPPPEGWPR